jgi:methylation protein EvaC
MKKEFLDLGQQPIANKFLYFEETMDENEFFFDLKVVFDEETKLVSLKEFVTPELMFNDEYKYNTSLSVPMVKHFKDTANHLKEQRQQWGYPTLNVLEIGSNDGPFISNFKTGQGTCVEPGNFAEVTEDMGYKTYTDFWTTDLAEKIVEERGTKMDLIYSANCICHIQDLDDCFTAVKNSLSERGMFVFEDPSLLRMMERGSYDQIYDEHAHVFSVIALKEILARNGLSLFKVENLSVHGGSNRIYARHMNINSDMFDTEGSVNSAINEEKEFGLDKFETYEVFADRVKKSKDDLVNKLKQLKEQGVKVASYGATSKSTTVFNYCDIGIDLIEIITDTTPDKIGLYAPGSHIPVKNRDEVDILEFDYLFLGAWNFKDSIANKEQEFINKGGKFITHVPQVMEFS